MIWLVICSNNLSDCVATVGVATVGVATVGFLYFGMYIFGIVIDLITIVYTGGVTFSFFFCIHCC